MKIPNDFEQTIDGKQYRIADSTLLAGIEFEEDPLQEKFLFPATEWCKTFKNLFLYRTQDGDYFLAAIYLPVDPPIITIVPVPREVAMKQYDLLYPNNSISYIKAFSR